MLKHFEQWRGQNYRALVDGLDEAGRSVSVEVAYQLGGMNYFTGNHDSRGVFLSLRHMTVKDGMQSFILGEGVKFLVWSQLRKSQKQTDKVAAALDQYVPEIAAAFQAGNNNRILELLANVQRAG